MRQLWNRCHNTGVALSLVTPVSMAVPASLRGGETAARLRSHTASEDRIFSVTGATTALCDRGASGAAIRGTHGQFNCF